MAPDTGGKWRSERVYDPRVAIPVKDTHLYDLLGTVAKDLNFKSDCVQMIQKGECDVEG